MSLRRKYIPAFGFRSEASLVRHTFNAWIEAWYTSDRPENSRHCSFKVRPSVTSYDALSSINPPRTPPDRLTRHVLEPAYHQYHLGVVLDGDEILCGYTAYTTGHNINTPRCPPTTSPTTRPSLQATRYLLQPTHHTNRYRGGPHDTAHL